MHSVTSDRHFKYRQTTLYGHPYITGSLLSSSKTRIPVISFSITIWYYLHTLRSAPLVTVLMWLYCNTKQLYINLLFHYKCEINKYQAGCKENQIERSSHLAPSNISSHTMLQLFEFPQIFARNFTCPLVK